MKQKEAILNDPTCNDCHGLWLEYALAAAKHIELDNKLKLATLSRDHDAIQALTSQVDLAQGQRELAREAIRQHEASHSSGARRP